MVVQTDDGPHGLLIDFDCAFDSSVARSPVRPERTGTLPFMSIGNLSKSLLPHNILDDWESLLYLICWTGTFGIQEPGPAATDDRELLIKSWTVGSPESIATKKKSVMNDSSTFSREILGKFDQNQTDCWRLEDLADELHETLFYNDSLDDGQKALCHGAITLDLSNPQQKRTFERRFGHVFGLSSGVDVSKLGSVVVDPFVERARHAQTITDDLLSKLQKYAESAREALKGSHA
ncbi:hypothetical protein H4R20_003038 [Coemansia guatemalensis]|uniref:Fungal-type protein kinase domain-containing protein n=1 Tax=Coemansia guatemalensis TaxID=2761395 RepID=A0A9W8LU36_9FUNG|nr:hypothetical protein H4R20_003038 [Coemansia guatemalensis]